MQPIQMEVSQKQKRFLNFFFFWHFENIFQILNIFQKKMTLIAEVFPELRAPKNVIR